ncbi:hypothetical protein K466DRAFT_129274 [Polyporus arcularius HHB13444]|uniref:Uncharacterized protein n=1 Tax=Polyporus arcularius HHB13444 TaxID=1314778 RepID=A0A5C3PUV4_9APHY|nr:hypothetical protein K466DRAFT_129274 [Polyporus arcularius HHB13444]
MCSRKASKAGSCKPSWSWRSKEVRVSALRSNSAPPGGRSDLHHPSYHHRHPANTTTVLGELSKPATHAVYWILFHPPTICTTGMATELQTASFRNVSSIRNLPTKLVIEISTLARLLAHSLADARFWTCLSRLVRRHQILVSLRANVVSKAWRFPSLVVISSTSPHTLPRHIRQRTEANAATLPCPLDRHLGRSWSSTCQALQFLALAMSSER